MMNVPIWVLLIVQLVALSLGAQLPANQPDGDQQKHEVSVPSVEQETIADDSSDAAFIEPVDSMETDATYHRRYYYPRRYYQRYPTYNYNTRRYYNTNYQYNRRPYYYNRYPQYNYRPAYRPAPAYRPSTYYPGTNNWATVSSYSTSSDDSSSSVDNSPPAYIHSDPPHIPETPQIHNHEVHIPHIEPPQVW